MLSQGDGEAMPNNMEEERAVNTCFHRQMSSQGDEERNSRGCYAPSTWRNRESSSRKEHNRDEDDESIIPYVSQRTLENGIATLIVATIAIVSIRWFIREVIL